MDAAYAERAFIVKKTLAKYNMDAHFAERASIIKLHEA